MPENITKNPLLILFAGFILNVCIAGPVTWIINEHVKNFDEFRLRTIQKIDLLNTHVTEINKSLAEGYLPRADFYREEGRLQERVKELEVRLYEIPNERR